METIGVFRADRDPPGVDRERWIALIGKHPNLTKPSVVQRFNPATKQPIAIKPPADFAQVVVDGRNAGIILWCESGASELNVFGDQQVEPTARAVASLLGASFIADA